MELKTKIRTILKENYGEFGSFLEIEYENKLIERLLRGNFDQKVAWATYNQVVLELKLNLKDTLKVQELQYMLTENTNPKEVCMKVIEPVKNLTPELGRLYQKIQTL